MGPNRNVNAEVPSTPYNRPKQFDTARHLFKRMIEEQTTPMPTARLFAVAASRKVPMPHSPPLTPEDEGATINLGSLSAPTPSASTSVAPCTPPPSIPRGPSMECPKLPRSKRNLLFAVSPPPVASSHVGNTAENVLGSPIELAPVPFTLGATTTPRKVVVSRAMAPWAPKRPSFAPTSRYGPRISLRKPLGQLPLYSSTASGPLTPTKFMDRSALVGRINKLESLVRNLQRELETQKTRKNVPSTPTRATRTTRRAIKSSRPRPILADSVFL